MVFDETQEFASVSNGAMSVLRILNGARANGAQLQFTLQVDINRVSNATMEIYKSKLLAYLKSKPREWRKLVSFRMNSVQPDSSGCVEYSFQLQHRENWQQKYAIDESRSDVSKFCLELQKSLGMNEPVVEESTPEAADDQSADENNRKNSEHERTHAMRVACVLEGMNEPVAEPVAEESTPEASDD